ncbi:hypothetical protein AB0B28_03720 [Glycomyces sp. NPDC046736]|uniref:hypothetical protein n=1 Tax=Glycomyces sp. NPDC046736 TaxID=3155615 RepID=UPI0033C0269D
MEDMVSDYGLPEFNARATALLNEQILAPGEQLRWGSEEGIEHFSVRGLEPDGKPIEYAVEAIWTILKIVFVPLWWFMTADNHSTSSSTTKSAPRSIVFGKHPDCTAVYRPGMGTAAHGSGLWVLTDRRLARYALRRMTIHSRQPGVPPRVESVECVLEFQMPIADVRFEPDRRRWLKGDYKPKRPRYHRFTFPDGSGFDIASNGT